MTEIQKMNRELRSERHVTAKKGTPYGKCIGQKYSEKVLRTLTLPDGRLVNVIRGETRYLHVTKGWRTRATSGLKYELAPTQAA